MLTPDELKVAPDNIVALYQRLEDDIITDIARRLEKAGEITGTAEWQIYMLTEMGKDLDDIKSKIAEVNHKSKAEVENLFDEAIARSVGRDNLLFQQAGKGTLDLAKNAGMQQFIAASAAKTAGDLKNLTKSLGFKDGNQFKPIARFYQDTLNYAQFQVASGAFSYQQAIRIATAKMVESGIRVVDYESGVSTRVDVAVRRATLTGINQTAAQITLMQMGELGGEYVEVTAHAGARPSHADWQGKVYHVGGDVKGYPDFEESTGYGTGEGLCGWNCRHNFHPFFPGISERSYTYKELENIDPPPFEYNGKTYTHYEATQKQRQIERAIRKTKQEMIVYDTTGLKKDFTMASVKLQRQKELYRDFSAKAGLRTKDERHQLYGFGRSVSQKGVQAAKREKSKPFVDNMANWQQVTPNKAKMVKDLMEYEIGGTVYKVDGRVVLLDYDSQEKQIASIIAEKYGKTVYMVPRILEPQGIKTPDYIIENKLVDLKTPTGKGKNAIYDRVKDSKKQAENFIVDISKSPYSYEKIQEQIYQIYISSRTEFVDEIIIIKDGEVLNAYKRKK